MSGGKNGDFETWGRVVLPGDTATNRAGSNARLKAREAAQKAPVRTAVTCLLRIHTDERAWRRGAEGEEEVARQLRKMLRNEWMVANDISVGNRGANIDHVVVGPPGVFTLNTKHLSGKVVVTEGYLRHNGYQTTYLRDARREADRASKLLSEAAGRLVNVCPVVVIMGAEVQFKAHPPDVCVVPRRDLRKWLSSLPRSLAHSEAEEIVKAVRLPTTWKRSVKADKRADRGELETSPAVGMGESRSEAQVLVVKRWHGYGRPRVYVNDEHGTALGWYDVNPKSLTIKVEALRPDIESAIAKELGVPCL